MIRAAAIHADALPDAVPLRKWAAMAELAPGVALLFIANTQPSVGHEVCAVSMGSQHACMLKLIVAQLSFV